MVEWTSVEKEKPPLNKKIFITDGKDVLSCQLEEHECGYGDNKASVIFIYPALISGWEWEEDIEYEEVTHWALVNFP